MAPVQFLRLSATHPVLRQPAKLLITLGRNLGRFTATVPDLLDFAELGRLVTVRVKYPSGAPKKSCALPPSVGSVVYSRHYKQCPNHAKS